MKKILFVLLVLRAVCLPAQVTFTESKLPIITINTNGQYIPDEPKITAQMGIIDNGAGVLNHVTDPLNGYNGSIGIEIRGSSSQFYDKKPYTIELRDLDGNDIDAPLLGMPAESDWGLISPLNDKTLMRDVLAHAAARDALEWSPRTRYCELVINGSYMGVYVLIELVKRGADRVPIKKMKDTDISGDALTGGYMLRMDKYGPSPGSVGGDFMSLYPSIPGGWQRTWFQYAYPKVDVIQPEQSAYIQQYIKDFENMMASGNFSSQYPNWLDLDSWVNYLLVEELTKNTDGYRLSAYFYKDRDSEGGKLKMGPVWDFNIAYGIGDYCEGADYTGWAKDYNSVCGGDGWVIHFWWEKMWNDPKFRARMVSRWQELRADKWSDAKLFGTIDSIKTLLDGAQQRNFQRWPVLGTYVWPNSFIGYSYTVETSFLENWLHLRLGWLDANITAMQTGLENPAFEKTPFTIYPNPVKDVLYIHTNYKDIYRAHFEVSIYDLAGNLIFTKSSVQGKGVLQFDLPERFSTGVYLYRIEDGGGKRWTGKLFVAQ